MRSIVVIDALKAPCAIRQAHAGTGEDEAIGGAGNGNHTHHLPASACFRDRLHAVRLGDRGNLRTTIRAMVEAVAGDGAVRCGHAGNARQAAVIGRGAGDRHQTGGRTYRRVGHLAALFTGSGIVFSATYLGLVGPGQFKPVDRLQTHLVRGVVAVGNGNHAVRAGGGDRRGGRVVPDLGNGRRGAPVGIVGVHFPASARPGGLQDASVVGAIRLRVLVVDMSRHQRVRADAFG